MGLSSPKLSCSLYKLCSNIRHCQSASVMQLTATLTTRIVWLTENSLSTAPCFRCCDLGILYSSSQTPDRDHSTHLPLCWIKREERLISAIIVRFTSNSCQLTPPERSIVSAKHLEGFWSPLIIPELDSLCKSLPCRRGLLFFLFLLLSLLSLTGRGFPVVHALGWLLIGHCFKHPLNCVLCQRIDRPP